MVDIDDFESIHVGSDVRCADGVWVIPSAVFRDDLMSSFRGTGVDEWAQLLTQVAVDLHRCVVRVGGRRVTCLGDLLRRAVDHHDTAMMLALCTQAAMAIPAVAMCGDARCHVGEGGGGAYEVDVHDGGRVVVAKTLRAFTVTPRGDDRTVGTHRVTIDVEHPAPVLIRVYSTSPSTS